MTTPPDTRMRGAFVVFEGVDRGGKTTQTALLVEHLNTRCAFGAVSPACESAGASPTKATATPNAVAFRFPTRTTPIGRIVDEYLQSRADVDDRAIHLLFAADRWDAASSIRRALQRGQHVVCDRYSYSGFAFSAAKGMPHDWCWACERGLPAPDLVLYLDVPVDVAKARGGFGGERYEREDMQRRVAAEFAFLRLCQALAAATPPAWRVIDATRSVEDVHSAVLRAVDEVCGARANEMLDIE